MQDDDFSIQFGDAARSGGLIDQRFFQVLLLLGVEVVIVFRNLGQSLGENLLAAYAHPLFAQATFEPFAAALRAFEGEYARRLQARCGGDRRLMLERSGLTEDELGRAEGGRAGDPS